jgi:hypothetical protein
MPRSSPLHELSRSTPLTIGRGAHNRLVLAGDTLVARAHASLHVDDASLTIIDHGCSGAVTLIVNDAHSRISSSRTLPLPSSFSIHIGDTRLRFTADAHAITLDDL